MRLLALSTLLTVVLATPAHATTGDCGQPRSEGDGPTVGDVLYILGAVIHDRDCPTQICDVDDDCRVTLRDALETLRYVIERKGELSCGKDCPVDAPRCGESEAPTCDGVCPEDHECKAVKKDNEIPVCHIPPGNDDAAHTIWIDRHAIPAHLAHGDYFGRCRGDDCKRHGGGSDDCRDDEGGKGPKDVSFARDESTWWWHPKPHEECECRRVSDSTTTTTSSTTTTTTTTTTTMPSGEDTDNDGIANGADPCPESARNLCAGPVAVDGTTESDIRVNAGTTGTCNGMKTDCTGAIWNADFGYNQLASSTSCTAAGGCPIAGVTELFGCTDEATQDLFRCEHWDAVALPELEYSFDVEDGTYVVNLFFANTFADTAAVGARTIDLVIEGQVVYPAFDQIAVAGGVTQTAVVRSAVVTVADGNGLQIAFGHVVENPAVKAIEVLKVAGP